MVGNTEVMAKVLVNDVTGHVPVLDMPVPTASPHFGVCLLA